MYFYILLFGTLYYLYHKYLILYNLIKKCYIHNQSWEDPNVDITAYQIKEDTNILMITTGGDNVLNYLLQSPEHIDTVDENIYQNYLLEMKMAIIKVYNQEEAFKILAQNDYKLFLRKFKALENYLSYECKRWWQENKEIMKQFHYSGTNKILINIVHTLIWILGLQKFIVQLKGCTFTKQQELYFKYKGKLDLLGNILNSIIIPILYYIGITNCQLYHSREHPSIWIKRLFLYTDINKNYFYYPYLYGCWKEDCCPAYLKKENYLIVKCNLHKIKIHNCKIHEIEHHITNEYYKFDRVILLDHMDSMQDSTIIDNWNKIIPYTTDNCLFCWKSYSYKQKFPSLSNLKYHLSSPVFPIYADKVTIYNSIHVASIKNKPLSNIYQPKFIINYKQKIIMIYQNIISCIKILFMKIKNDKIENLDNYVINKYYENQAKYYDPYQYNIQHGKLNMMYGIPFKKDMNILVLAGGTGDILYYIYDFIPQCKKITISDISLPMIKEVRKKINYCKWKNVRAILSDATRLHETDKYDLIIISYSISMIPKWETVIKNCKKSLKIGGYLACSDYTVDIKQNWIIQQFWKLFFWLYYIKLSNKHLQYMKNLFTIKFGRIEYGDYPFIPFIKCPYYYAIFQKQDNSNAQYYYC